ncbi:phage replisome organizer N-terminal domain-containing protein [Lactiplantibacillus plantarum]|uniref:phage replisome organizer N-terminal domain-containing protein n=1 Tax=Lactiplantibacillus plantarum TaxID=1590 RepID=UPI00217E4189|nr:phage replisome organizer N-terminal domain-containing protein [Lactiplantibacillus plantarum]UWF30264.1 phage replisome organizer N-terminal domain-containing protein [Lactiplantibacillus plantarum]UWF40296.1 phage replisome organizer N-terminal domain-containing protein [Lactiplantibacillus plantarum]UWF43295.1 phage replisome organizer N-terminal domain-containing protein [Lactiplantibacillus plantarum]
MAEKTYYWIKLQMDFFKSPAVRLLRTMSGGDTYALIYLEMILLSLENHGYIYFTGIGKTFSEEIALVLNEETVDVEFLMSFLDAKKLVEYPDDNSFKFADDVVEGLIGKESSSAKRVRAYRKRQKQIALQSNDSVTGRNTDIDKDLDLDLDLEPDKENSAANATPSTSLEDDFNVIWDKYPNKKGKKQALVHYKAWRKKSVKHTNEYLLERLSLYLADLSANAWKQPMNGATWFNGRFDDDYQMPQNNGRANSFELEHRDVTEDDLPW